MHQTLDFLLMTDSQVIISKYSVLNSLIDFVFANSTDPDKKNAFCGILSGFIVCQSTRLECFWLNVKDKIIDMHNAYTVKPV